MAENSGVTFAGETDEYRSARAELLEAERELRREVARVAALRQALPDGHRVPTDYAFSEIDRASGDRSTVKLSELFALPGKSLVLYNFMYAGGAKPCPMCTAFLDSFNGAAPHIEQQVNLGVVAKGPIEQLTKWADERGWSNLRMLSSDGTSFNADYLAEVEGGAQVPMLNVFRKAGGAVHHFYTSELFYAPAEPGQHPRHIDMIFPLWNVLDLTAEGRPDDWFPQLAY